MMLERRTDDGETLREGGALGGTAGVGTEGRADTELSRDMKEGSGIPASRGDPTKSNITLRL